MAGRKRIGEAVALAVAGLMLFGCARFAGLETLSDPELFQTQHLTENQFEIVSGRVRVLIGFAHRPMANEENLVRQAGGEIRRSFRHVGVIAASVPAAALDWLRRNPYVVFFEPDGRVSAVSLEADNSHGVVRIGAPAVHSSGGTGSGVKIAVLDTGLDYTHPDLASAYRGGFDFVNGDSDPMDDNGHGTHVAGVIGAQHNGTGVIGVAPQAELYALKVLDRSGTGYLSDVIAAIEWAMDNGIQIINMSLGGGGSDALAAVCQAASARGILLVAAAGNAGMGPNTVLAPARYPSVIAVAATDQTDARAAFSSTGPAVAIAAPGVSIYSSLPGRSYGHKSGTSMASPHVAGTAALVWSANPSWTNREVRARLTDTALDLGIVGKDDQHGYGLVDAAQAACGELPPLVVEVTPASAELNCRTTTVILTAQVAGTTSPSAYQWHRDDNAIPTATGYAYVADQAGAYRVTVTAADGRTASSHRVLVAKVDPPQPRLTPASAELSASVTAVTLTIAVTGGRPPYTYQWFRDGSALSGTSPSRTVSQAGSYEAIVTDASGCVGSSNRAVVTTVAPLRVEVTPSRAALTAATASVKLAATVTGGQSPYTYAWHRDGNVIPFATGSTHAAGEAGAYRVEVSDVRGRRVVSASASVTSVSDPTAPTLHIADIAMTCTNRRTSAFAQARVRVVDAAGNPVARATVTGRWAGSTRNVRGTTDSRGFVTFRSSTVRKGASAITFEFCVLNIARTGWQYNSTANVETCDSITAP